MAPPSSFETPRKCAAPQDEASASSTTVRQDVVALSPRNIPETRIFPERLNARRRRSDKRAGTQQRHSADLTGDRTMLRKVTLGLIAAASLSVAALAPGSASAHGFHGGGGWGHHGGWGHGFGF